MADTVTKKDLQAIEKELNKKISELRAEAESEIEGLEKSIVDDVDKRFKELDPKLKGLTDAIKDLAEAIKDNTSVIQIHTKDIQELQSNAGK